MLGDPIPTLALPLKEREVGCYDFNKLKAHFQMKKVKHVWITAVVGHTDSVGQIEANMKLSQARAEAVVQALTKSHGVAATRLKAHGAGPIAPVVTNRTEEGRAKNRRVELVEQ